MRCLRQDMALFVVRATFIRQVPNVKVVTDHEMVTGAGLVGTDLVVTRAGVVATAIALGGDRVGRVTRLRALELAGVPCSWRIELDRHPGYRGPLPVIFVRMARHRAWHERFYFGRRPAAIPLCIATDSGECTQLVTLRLDPRDVTPTHGVGLLASEDCRSS